jgi:mycothiol synthase
MGNDPAAHELHENEGYQPVRYFWEMETVMESPPEAPVWPEGISVRNYVPGEDDRATFDAFEEAFRDHWGYSPWDYKEWHTRRHERDHFDPSLWWLAMDGGEIAGGVICRYRQERGWISQLAVRKPWRRRGLGTALLLNALGEFYCRGRNTVALGVDADNPTGATLVYERAGMYVNSKFVVYEKEIRPGLKVRE